uniref:Virion-associated protein n=1 Tax=Carnation etched ring virus TaxID=10640 RepID=Q683K9_CERV|nr:DNA binding protein [Carnation etched ring virus]CAH68827.1 DNA-binding protein [Carnation etched ring virus]
MNLATIASEIEVVKTNQKTIESKIDQILAKIGSTPEESSNLESVAAKIISDLTKEMKECHCNKEIVEILNKDKAIIPSPERDSIQKKLSEPQYTFPNFDVGNEGMGSSTNPNALKWPPTEKPQPWPPR